MKDSAGQVSIPEWQYFLHIGEQLLKQADPADQCEIIKASVKSRICCLDVNVWLASPYYPLPGISSGLSLTRQSQSPLVQSTVNNQQTMLESNSILPANDWDGSRPIHTAAVPIITQDFLLGVIEVQNPVDVPLSKQNIIYLQKLAANAATAMQVTRQVTLKNWRYEQLALVRSVSNQIANVMDLDLLCEKVTELICGAFKYYFVSIFTLEDNCEYLRFRKSAVREPTVQTPKFNIKIGEGIVGHVAKTGQEIIAGDVQNEPHYLSLDYLPKTRSEAALPLRVEDRILGVLDIQSDQPDAFHQVDMLVIHSLADSIALAVEGARLYSDLRQSLEKISAVSEIGRALTSILELDKLPDEAVQLIQERLGYPYVHLFSVHSGRRLVIYLTGSGRRSQAMHDREITYNLDAPQGIIPWVARNGQSVLANDVNLDPRYIPTSLPPEDTLSELTIPLIFGGEILGVLDIQSDKTNAFNVKDLPVFEAVAASLATALRNATLYRSEIWRRQVTESLHEVAGLLSEKVALDELLDSILSELERNLPCETAAIWLVDESESQNDASELNLKLAAAHGIEPAEITAAHQASEAARAFLRDALTKTQPTIRRPDQSIDPLGTAMRYPSDYSSIAAPLHIGEQTLGLITLAHPTYGRYGSEAAAMTSTFASYAGSAIQNARLYVQSQQQAWISTVLLQVAETYQAAESIDELLSTTTRLIPLLIGVKQCGIFLWEDASQIFILTSWYGLRRPPSKTIFSPEDAIAFKTLNDTLSPVFITNIQQDLNLPELDLPDEQTTLVLLPLIARNKLLGAIIIAHQATGQPFTMQFFNDQTILILEGITRQTALALENLQLLEARQEEGYVTAVMLQVAQAVASQNNLQDILETIIHLMPILVGVDSCAIYLWDDKDQIFHPATAFSSIQGFKEKLLAVHYAAGEFPLLDNVQHNRKMVFCPLISRDLSPEHWKDLVCFPSLEQNALTSIRGFDWIIGFPLAVKSEIYGVLVANDTGASPAFREKRIEIVSGIAQQIALAIQNEKLNQEMVERERMEREIQLARQIQQAFLPDKLPEAGAWKILSKWNTARSVGGDFYDAFPLDDDQLGLVIADVADKGMAAALYMTVTRTLIRANSKTFTSPAAVLEKVNELLTLDSQNGMFVTAVYAVLNLKTGFLIYANAGHNLPLLSQSSGSIVKPLLKGGLALGILDKISLLDHQIQILPGDCLLLYTDGVTETFSPSGEPFGERRLRSFLRDQSCNSLESMFERLDQALIDFRQGMPPSDDVTLLAVRRAANGTNPSP